MGLKPDQKLILIFAAIPLTPFNISPCVARSRSLERLRIRICLELMDE